MKEIEFSCAFCFEYSPRQGTPAMRWRDDVPVEKKAERLQRLLTLQDGIYAKQRQAMLGSDVEVLVEKQTNRDEKRVKGRTRCWKNVVFEGTPEMVGTFQTVRLQGYSHQTLLGEVVCPA